MSLMVKTGQGRKVYPFKDSNNVECTIQESEKDFIPSIWLGCNQPNPRTMTPFGWVTVELPKGTHCNTRMFLSQSQVQSLLPLLRKFARTGKL